MKNIWIFAILLLLLLTQPLFSATSIQGEDLMTGKPIEVSAKSKGLVIAFLSARCPCSNSHLPMLEKLSHDFPDFQFVGVHSNADESKDPTQTYFKDAHLSFPLIQDFKFKLADQFKASKTPHVFVLSPGGETLYKGGMTNSADGPSADRQYLKDALTALQAGQKMQTSETRSLGCAISRGETYVW